MSEFFAKDIRRRVQQRGLVVVVGAGVSISATEGQADVASWIGLLRSGVARCAELMRIDTVERTSLDADVASGALDRVIFAAQRVSDGLGGPTGGDFVEWIKETVGGLTVRNARVIRALMSLGCRIATTNYDDLLEQVLVGHRSITWLDQPFAHEWLVESDSRQIMHLHGHWRRPESIVLGSRSYEDVLRNKFAQNLLHSMSFTHPLLFVGFGAGLADPNFGALLQWINDALAATMTRHYQLVLKGEATIKVQRVGHPRVFPVEYGASHDSLGPFLEGLVLANTAAGVPSGRVSNVVPSGDEKRFFISYRHGEPDEGLAQRLHQGLASNGHRVTRDVDLKVGDDWIASLAQHIAECHFLVVLLSETSIESEMVLSEVRDAREKERRDGRPRILPVRVDYDGPLGYELNLYLGHLHHVAWHGPQDDARVVTALLEAIDGPPPPGPNLSAPDQSAGDGLARGANAHHGDPRYLAMESHQRAMRTVEQHPITLTIFGPRGFGKTRLLLRCIETCRRLNRKVVHIDLQGIEERCLVEYGTFLTALASEILLAVGIDQSPAIFKEQSQMRRFMQKNVLGQVEGPVVLAFDHLDRVVGRTYQFDFFAMLRSWYDKRETEDPWTRLGMVLVVSTEPSLLIRDARQSPFNVGERVDLKPLSPSETRQFIEEGDTPLHLSQDELRQLQELLGGHPYLLRRACDALRSGMTFKQLVETAESDAGPFRDHLRALLTLLAGGKLIESVRDAINTGSVREDTVAARLCAAGVLVQRKDRYDPANGLYARFFRRGP